MNGLLLLDKPQGMTSHDVVYRVRRATGIREVGHAGTLDPMATGLLVMCVGKAVRLSEYLIGKDKTYAGRLKLGERTNTDDADGEVVERREVHATDEDLERVRAALTGDIRQVPPQFSAVQREGKRAYQMARKGEAVDLPSRLVRIAALELVPVDDGPRTTDDGFQEPTVVRRPSSVVREVDLRVACSAGTYVRALARDIGELLGCGAHLTALRRTGSGAFTLDDAIALRDFEQAAARGDWQQCLLPMDRAVDGMPRCDLDAEAGYRFQMGQFVPLPDAAGEPRSDSLYRVYCAGQFIALGLYDPPKRLLKPAKVFQQPAAT